ncbi:MAG: MBL fold metallo-hydrolase [Pseudomonadota bacterium]
MLAKIGDVEVWRILESDGPLMPVARFFPTLTAEALEANRAAAGESIAHDPAAREDWVRLPVQAFLLRTPRRLILVDACVGNHKTVPHLPQWHDRRDGRFLAGLAAAGASAGDVDLVLCTHLHVDHVGWTTSLDGDRWVPTFPNARVLASAEDLAMAEARAAQDPDGAAGHVHRQTLRPLQEAGRLETLPLAQAGDVSLDPSIRLTPTPGHTPGHLSVVIRAPQGPGAAVTGDLIHSPIQCALPDLCPIVDADAATASATRRAFMEESADSGRLNFATHFPLPSVGRFRRDGEAFAWDDAF